MLNPIPFQDTLIKMDELYETTKALIELGYYGLTEAIDVYTFSFSLSENIMAGPVGARLVVGKEEYSVNCGKDVNKTLRSLFDLRDSISLAAGLSGYDELKKAMDKKISGVFKLTLFVNKGELYFNVCTNGYEYVLGRPVTIYKESNSVCNTIVLKEVLSRMGSVIGNLTSRVLMLEEKLNTIEIVDESAGMLHSEIEVGYAADEMLSGFNNRKITESFLTTLNALLRENKPFPIIVHYDDKNMTVYEDGLCYSNGIYIGNLIDYLYSLDDEVSFIVNYPKLSSWVNKTIKMKRGAGPS